MDNYIGKSGVVVGMDKKQGISVCFSNIHESFWFPSLALEKVICMYKKGTCKLNLSNLFLSFCDDNWKNELILKFGAKYGFFAEIDIDEMAAYAQEVDLIELLIQFNYLERQDEYYKIGDWFVNTMDDKFRYILADVDGHNINLINIDTGARVRGSILMETGSISVAVFEKHFNNTYHIFKKIKKDK